LETVLQLSDQQCEIREGRVVLHIKQQQQQQQNMRRQTRLNLTSSLGWQQENGTPQLSTPGDEQLK